MCALRAGFFCADHADHLVVRKGVATCEWCAVERERLEHQAEYLPKMDRVVALICADAEGTIGPGYVDPIVEAAAPHRLLYAGDRVKYVDQVRVATLLADLRRLQI